MSFAIIKNINVLITYETTSLTKNNPINKIIFKDNNPDLS